MTRSSELVEIEVVATLQRLAEATRELVWDWDRRFDTAVGRVSAPEHLPVLALLDGCFAHRWDHTDIDTAPAIARELAGGWGGLRPGQRLWLSSADESPLLFAAWWPWGSGTTFSVRVGCRRPTGVETRQQQAARVRALFRA